MSDPVTRAVAGPPPGPPWPVQPPTLVAPGPTQPGVPLSAAPSAPLVRPDSVRLEGVSKTYGTGKDALLDVDLAIPEGDFVFLVGPSGAGKSTLIKLLVRDEKATVGEVLVVGHDLGHMKKREVPLLRRKIGIVFQDFRLLPRKTVHENVAFALEVTGTPKRLVVPAVQRALALVGLTEQARQRPDQLSGGEQQRTAIARAMVHEPRLIIADEPTGNLDPLISWEIIQLLLRINEMGTTVLMATHDAEVVTALRRRVVALEDGRVVRDEVGGYHREY
jgi:cell division transport system ATP-binding protein